MGKKGIEIQNAYSEAAYDKITRFPYEDMHTWLYFDSQNRLTSIDQQKDFSVVQREEADMFFRKTKKLLIQKYDEPNTEANDTANKIITLTWNLKFTEVLFTYDYRYKIIDELGCCSYKVDIHFNPIEQADTSKFAIFTLKDYLQHPFADKGLFADSKPADLSRSDVNEINVLLKQCLVNYKTIDITQYIRQCVAVMNKKNEKEVWVNCYCNPQNGPMVNWKKQIIIVPDGGDCFFNLKINLTTKKFYDLKINGKG